MAGSSEGSARVTSATVPGPNHDRALVDAPLAADVRLLSSLLGNTIRVVDGEDVFNAVEQLRGLAQRRRGVRQEPEPQLTAEIVDLVQSWPLWLAAEVGNAFLTYFLLTNTAEETHRIRRRRLRSSDANAAPRSIAAVVEQLLSQGYDEATIRKQAAGIHLQPVFTAHPTESQRLTMLGTLQDVHRLLLEREHAIPAELDDIDLALRTHIEGLWQADHLRHRRPTVLEESRLLLRTFETTLWDAVPEVTRRFRQATGVTTVDAPAPIILGSWMGGDADGNPNVTPDLTWQTALTMRARVLRMHLEAVRSMDAMLPHSVRRVATSQALDASLQRDARRMTRVEERLQNRNQAERYRHKIRYMTARLQATLEADYALLDTRAAQIHDARLTANEPDGVPYDSARDFVDDLQAIADSLRHHGAHSGAEQVVQPLIDRAKTFGFHLATLDIRDHADRFHAAADEVLKGLDIQPPGGSYLELDKDQREAFLAGELDRDYFRSAMQCRRTTTTPCAASVQLDESSGSAEMRRCRHASSRWRSTPPTCSRPCSSHARLASTTFNSARRPAAFGLRRCSSGSPTWTGPHPCFAHCSDTAPIGGTSKPMATCRKSWSAIPTRPRTPAYCPRSGVSTAPRMRCTRSLAISISISCSSMAAAAPSAEAADHRTTPSSRCRRTRPKAGSSSPNRAR